MCGGGGVVKSLVLPQADHALYIRRAKEITKIYEGYE